MHMMKKLRSGFWGFVLIIAAAASVLAFSLHSYSLPSFAADAPAGKDACLACHGPFDKLAKAPKTFVSESGDKINPHWYVPHNKQDAKSVPECANCHQPHPVPLKSKEALPKAGVEWCSSCHHTGDLKACSSCH